MIAGGNVNGDDTMTEIVTLVSNNSTPSFGQLPSARSGAVGAMLGNGPIICGGYDGTARLDTCISYHQDSEWIQSNTMVHKRRSAAAVKVNSTMFFIMGGSDGSSFLDSTELVIQGQTNGVPGPKLPYKLINMCAVKLSQSEIFVIGGFGGNSDFVHEKMNEVWIYDPQNGFARTQGPSLRTSRSNHACSTMRHGEKNLIVVAGGGYLLDSVEIYDPTDNIWHSGKNKYPMTQKTKINENA